MLPALALLSLLAASTPAPPTAWVTDEAGALDPATRSALDRELEAYQRSAGRQVVVFVGRTTGGEPIEDWAARTFAAWKVGRAKLDDGAALFVMVDDRAARIEVGYGLEPILTDVASARLLREQLVPRMKAGDVDGAVGHTVRAMLATLGGGPSGTALTGLLEDERYRWAAGAVALVAFIALAIFKPRWALFLLYLAMGSRRRGRRDGFGGGGGRSGGGGATSHW
jgi:uncharacterized protein